MINMKIYQWFQLKDIVASAFAVMDYRYKIIKEVLQHNYNDDCNSYRIYSILLSC